MSDTFVKELTADLSGILKAAGFDAYVDSGDGGDILVTEYGDDNAADSASVIINRAGELLSVYICAAVWSGLDGGRKDDIAKLLPYLNRYLSLGDFELEEEDGTLEFRYSFIADEKTDRPKLLKIIAAAYAFAARTADEGALLIAPLISGEVQVSELMNDDTSIIQL